VTNKKLLLNILYRLILTEMTRVSNSTGIFLSSTK
jgi:hypothetical protein